MLFLAVQELEGERDKLEEALRSERDKRDQQAMSLRQEAAAVQLAADDDKHRTCAPFIGHWRTLSPVPVSIFEVVLRSAFLCGNSTVMG